MTSLFWAEQKMFNPVVTGTQNVQDLRVNYIPAVFMDRGQVEEADSNLAHNTHKLTVFKDVEDEIFKRHGDGSEELHILGLTEKNEYSLKGTTGNTMTRFTLL